jgi:hypothetical protein
MSTTTPIDPGFKESLEASNTGEALAYLYSEYDAESAEAALVVAKILELPFTQLAGTYFRYFNAEEDNPAGLQMFEVLYSRMTSIPEGLEFIGAHSIGSLKFNNVFERMLEFETSQPELEDLADFFSENLAILNRAYIRKVFDRADALGLPTCSED